MPLHEGPKISSAAPSGKRARSASFRPTDGPLERSTTQDRKDALLQDGGRHLATKVLRDLARSAAAFKVKLGKLSFGPDLEHFLALVPPAMTQNMAPELSKFRTFLSRFTRGCDNHLVSFMKWYEWSCFEAGKHNDYNDTAQGGVEVNSKPPKTALGQVSMDRKHVRALLAMTLRHNSSRRAEGLHALLNYLHAQLRETETFRTLDELRDANPNVSYAFSRLVLGMATENFANVVLHCHALCEALIRCHAVNVSIIFNLLDTELAMASRVHAAASRLKKTSLNQGEDDIDPEDLSDPTIGERRQKTMAAVFTIVSWLASKREMSDVDAGKLAVYLAFCYVEHKGLRMLTGNVLLELVNQHPAILNDPTVCEWLAQTHFKFSKVDYLRPEGIQFLMHLMTLDLAGALPSAMVATTPPAIQKVLHSDPLEPSTLETLAIALFRKEQVTSCHPLIHPVWRQFIAMMEARAVAGESLKNHISNFVHNVIAPFRRGVADSPRQELFRKLVQSVGQLGLKAVDEEDRAQAVKEAAALGFGKKMAVGKVSTPQELRAMTVDELAAKLHSLLNQYERSLHDRSMSATRVRTWILREVKAAMAVEQRQGVNATYGDDVVKLLFRFSFEKHPRQDSFNENKAIYTLCDILARSARRSTKGTIRGREKTRTSLSPLTLVNMYLDLEKAAKTRFSSCASSPVFAAAREKIVASMQPGAPRSVVFFENNDMMVLFLMLFFVMSTDDPSNEVAVGLAESSVTDLLSFYAHGTLETIDVLVDVLMSFIMRPTAPLQVIPIMATLRPIAMKLLLRFARFYKTRSIIDMIVQPLSEAYGTAEREILRQKQAQADEAAAGEDENTGKGSEEDTATEADGTEPSDADKNDTTEADEDEAEEEEDADEDKNEESASAKSDAPDVEGSDDDDESWATEGEDEVDEQASPEYLQSLQQMLATNGAADVVHMYPTDVENKAKSDVVRATTLAARLGVCLRTPLMLHVFQVLLAVLRQNVKERDEVVFDAAKAAVESMLRSRNRYFGYFVNASSPTLRVLLADILGYCRKSEDSLYAKKGKEKGEYQTAAEAHSRSRRRLATLKALALSVMHYIGYLAYKNHADEAVRVTLMEHYRMLFCDRGWDHSRSPQQLRRDMFHFRHGFAWCFMDAIFSKFTKIREIASARRTFAFIGACDAIRAMLPRLTGLPADLKNRCAGAIRDFLQGTPIQAIYDMKHTTLFDYFGALKMALEYNRRVELDVTWAAEVLREVTDDDAIQVTSATARICAVMEKILGVTSRILNVKACVPQGVLHKQHPTPWRRKVTRKRAYASRERSNVEKEILAIRNHDPTPEEREQKKHRREELQHTDRAKREQLRKERWDSLTAEEKDEARRRSKAKKQERIAKNRDYKHTLYERRSAALRNWRYEKIKEAAEA